MNQGSFRCTLVPFLQGRLEIKILFAHEIIALSKTNQKYNLKIGFLSCSVPRKGLVNIERAFYPSFDVSFPHRNQLTDFESPFKSHPLEISRKQHSASPHNHLTVLFLSSFSSKHISESYFVHRQLRVGVWFGVGSVLRSRQTPKGLDRLLHRPQASPYQLASFACFHVLERTYRVIKERNVIKMTRLIVYSTAFIAFLGGKLNAASFSCNSSLTSSSDCDDLGSNFHTGLGNLDC